MLGKRNILQFTAILFVMFSVQLFAQRTITIEPGFGTLGSTIFGDTTSTGDRTDPNTVYLLKRDQLYILDGEFSPTFPLVLQAEDGTGARPRIILGVPTGGTTPDQTIRPRADITLKGLYISAQDELGGMGSRVIRHEENGIKVVIDDCHLDIAGQAAFRVNTDDTKTFMTNTIISNIGTMASPDNGRCFDDRGNDIDTLYIENCTFYNLTSQVVRDGGGNINYAYFNHNTFNNIGGGGSVGQYTVEAGSVNEFVFTNNLVKDGNSLGASDGVGAIVSMLPPSDSGATQTAVIKNNNIFWTESLVSSFPDTVLAPVAYDSLVNSYIEANGTVNTNISEYLDFTDGPDVSTPTMLAFWAAGDPVDFDMEGSVDFDFTYPTTAVSYTAGTSGQPMGALTWFDMPVGVEDEISQLPLSYKLFNNYPNPFNPTTNISFNLPKEENIKLDIYNILGQKIVTLINGKMQAGNHNVNFIADNLPSGLYIYQLQAGNFLESKKMMLLK